MNLNSVRNSFKEINHEQIRMAEEIGNNEPFYIAIINKIIDELLRSDLDIFCRDFKFNDDFQEYLKDLLNNEWKSKIGEIVNTVCKFGFCPFKIAYEKGRVVLRIPTIESYRIFVYQNCIDNTKRLKFFWKKRGMSSSGLNWDDYTNFMNFPSNSGRSVFFSANDDKNKLKSELSFPYRFFNENYRHEELPFTQSDITKEKFKEMIRNRGHGSSKIQTNIEPKLIETQYGVEDPDVIIFVYKYGGPNLNGTLNSDVRVCFPSISFVSTLLSQFMHAEKNANTPLILLKKNETQMSNEERMDIFPFQYERFYSNVVDDMEAFNKIMETKKGKRFEELTSRLNSGNLYDNNQKETKDTTNPYGEKLLGTQFQNFVPLPVNTDPVTFKSSGGNANSIQMINLHLSQIADVFGISPRLFLPVSNLKVTKEDQEGFKSTTQKWEHTIASFFSKIVTLVFNENIMEELIYGGVSFIDQKQQKHSKIKEEENEKEEEEEENEEEKNEEEEEENDNISSKKKGKLYSKKKQFSEQYNKPTNLKKKMVFSNKVRKHKKNTILEKLVKKNDDINDYYGISIFDVKENDPYDPNINHYQKNILNKNKEQSKDEEINDNCELEYISENQNEKQNENLKNCFVIENKKIFSSNVNPKKIDMDNDNEFITKRFIQNDCNYDTINDQIENVSINKIIKENKFSSDKKKLYKRKQYETEAIMNEEIKEMDNIKKVLDFGVSNIDENKSKKKKQKMNKTNRNDEMDNIKEIQKRMAKIFNKINIGIRFVKPSEDYLPLLKDLMKDNKIDPNVYRKTLIETFSHIPIIKNALVESAEIIEKTKMDSIRQESEKNNFRDMDMIISLYRNGIINENSMKDKLKSMLGIKDSDFEKENFGKNRMLENIYNKQENNLDFEKQENENSSFSNIHKQKDDNNFIGFNNNLNNNSKKKHEQINNKKKGSSKMKDSLNLDKIDK